MKKEKINHPKHYNNHPSGVEAIEIIRSFSFNLGNTFKYVFRRNDKENYIEDLNKALFYVKDEIEFRKNREVGFFSRIARDLQLPDLFKFKDYAKRTVLIKKILSSESSFECKIIYKHLNEADYYIYDITDLLEASIALEILIEQLKKGNHGKNI